MLQRSVNVHVITGVQFVIAIRSYLDKYNLTAFPGMCTQLFIKDPTQMRDLTWIGVLRHEVIVPVGGGEFPIHTDLRMHLWKVNKGVTSTHPHGYRTFP